MMSDLVNNATTVARDAVSTVLCGAAGASRFANDFLQKTGGVYDQTPGGRIARAGERALARFCPVPPPDAPGEYLPGDPGFEGGQCPFSYIVNVTTFIGENENTTGDVFAPGPIAGVYAEDLPNDRFGAGLLVGDPQEQQVVISSGEEVSVRINSVEPRNGEPDDCGDPPPTPPEVEPPPPSSPTPPPVVINIDLPDIGPVDVTFAPTVGVFFVDADFNLKVPVTVNISAPITLPAFDVDVVINLTDPTAPPELPPKEPDVDEDDRPNYEDCPYPPDCIEPPMEEEQEEPPEEDGDDDGDVLEVVAIQVRVLSIGPLNRATQIGQDLNPDIFAPNLGFCNFGYRSLDGSLVWSEDIPVKNTSFIVGAPRTGLRCVAGFGTPGIGVDWELKVLQAVPERCSS